jgi:8-oxo-dGTP diphosphatase
MARPRSRTPEEQRYLQGYDAGRFPHPSVTVDVALLTADEGALRALLIRRRAFFWSSCIRSERPIAIRERG